MLTRVVKIAGLDVCLVARSAAWEPPVLGLATALGIAADPGVSGRASITFGGPGRPRRLSPPDIDDPEILAWIDEDNPELVSGPVRICVDGPARVSVTAPDDAAPGAVHRALPFSLSWILSGHDLWVLHASAVAAPSGGGALLVTGPSGAGKSTVAAAALSAGWPILSDDLVVVRRGPRGAEVQGLRCPLAFPPEVRWSGDGGRSIPGDIRRRWAPEDAGWRPQPSPWLPLRAVIAVGHGAEAASCARPLDSMALLSTVWGAHFPAALRIGLAAWLPVAGEISRAPGWTLELGTDSGVRLESTAAALRDVDMRSVA